MAKRASKFTARVFIAPRAPKRLQLHGVKARGAESAQHVIEFPGGAIELTRTTDDCYWAHIIVNRGDVLEDVDGRQSARGEIIGSRLGYTDGVVELPADAAIEQIAVLIRPVR